MTPPVLNVLMKLEFSRQIFEKYQIPCNSVQCEPTDMKLIVVCRDFANVPPNDNALHRHPPETLNHRSLYRRYCEHGKLQYLRMTPTNRICMHKDMKSSTLTLRSLTLYIYGAPILDVSRSHTTTQHSR